MASRRLVQETLKATGVQPSSDTAPAPPELPELSSVQFVAPFMDQPEEYATPEQTSPELPALRSTPTAPLASTQTPPAPTAIPDGPQLHRTPPVPLATQYTPPAQSSPELPQPTAPATTHKAAITTPVSTTEVPPATPYQATDTTPVSPPKALPPTLPQTSTPQLACDGPAPASRPAPQLPETPPSSIRPPAEVRHMPPQSSPELPAIKTTGSIHEAVTETSFGSQVEQPSLTLPAAASPPMAATTSPSAQTGPPSPDLPHIPKQSQLDAEWIEQVMASAAPPTLPKTPPKHQAGHGSFKLDDPHGDVKHTQEQVTEERSTKHVVDAMREMQESIYRTQYSSNGMTYDILRQLSIDNNNDDRRLRELTSALQRSRTTLTDTNI